jgi:hypothetical protein
MSTSIAQPTQPSVFYNVKKKLTMRDYKTSTTNTANNQSTGGNNRY